MVVRRMLTKFLEVQAGHQADLVGAIAMYMPFIYSVLSMNFNNIESKKRIPT